MPYPECRFDNEAPVLRNLVAFRHDHQAMHVADMPALDEIQSVQFGFVVIAPNAEPMPAAVQVLGLVDGERRKVHDAFDAGIGRRADEKHENESVDDEVWMRMLLW